MVTARGDNRWLTGRAAVRVVPGGVLLLLLAAVHEMLLASSRPATAGEAAYLQCVVLAQCVFLAATVGAVMAVAPRLSRALAALTFTLPALLYVDTVVALRIDRHLPSVAALLFSAYLTENQRLLEAAGIDLRAIALFLVGLVVLASAGVWLDAATARRSEAWSWARAMRRTVLLIWVVATAVLGGLEAGAIHAVRASTWVRFGRSVPLVLGALGPTTRARASFQAALRPLPPETAVADALARLEVPVTPPPGDVFFFVVESLRADAFDPRTAPALAAVQRDAIPIGTTVSGGDVTQYGWFSLFRSRPPLYWELDSEGDHGGGAVPLRVARRRGWRVEALASSDLRYMHIDDAVLGAARALADDVYDASQTPGTAADHDRLVMNELAARTRRPHVPTVFIVALDATHLPYVWTDDFDPPFRPYAGPGHYMHVQLDAADQLTVVNRYRDAVAFVDSLVGRFVATLRAAGSYDDATLVVTGDHGEEFWEHGLTAHASEVCSAQTHVPLIVKLSRAMRDAGAAPAPVSLASSIDVWPTLLDAAGVRGDTSLLFDGQSLLRRPTGGALAVNLAYWRRPGHFVIDDGREKLVLELSDAQHPFRTQEVLVLDLLDEDDAPTHPGATASEYLAVVRRTFGRDVERFLVPRW